MSKKTDNNMFDKLAEVGVITTLIKNPSFMAHAEFLKARHFFEPENQSIYWAISELSKQGVDEIDAFNLTQKINSTKSTQARLANVGGDDHIRKLVDDAGFTCRSNPEEYKALAKKVSEFGFRRKLQSTLKGYEKECLNVDKPLNELNSMIITDLSDIGNKFIGNNEFQLYGDKIDGIMERIASRRHGGVYGISPTWDCLKPFITYVPQDLYVYMGRYKSGKSLVLASEMVTQASEGKNVVMFDTELDDDLSTLRLLSIKSGIPIDDLKIGKILDHNEQDYLNGLHFLKNGSFHREYSHSWTPASIQQRLEQTIHKLGSPEIFIFDYIKNIEKKNTSASELSNYLGNFTDFIKNSICGKHDMVGLTAVQISRSGEIASSDEIARYATAGIEFRRKTMEEIVADGVECGNYAMEVKFNRSGASHQGGDYLDFFVEQEPSKMNLRIHESKQHETVMPEQFKG